MDGNEFSRLTDPYRGELLAHCYRMLGSVQDAEDTVQDTYLRAWRSIGGFEGRSSLRTWLYRIATMACLRTIERNQRRPLPSGLGAPSDRPEGPLAHAGDVAWLQPLPDALLAGGPADPAAVAVARSSVRLAFVAALQHLPARQRAVLILRDVLAWQAAEVAELLDTTAVAVNSALRRARAQLAAVAPAEDTVREPTDPGHLAFLDRYVAAFEDADIDALMRVLRDDVVFEMPPVPDWFRGRDTLARFIASHGVLGAPGSWRMVPTGANGQPAYGMYVRHADGRFHAHGIQVLTVTATGIAHVVTFLDPALFARFGLPDVRAGVPVRASR